VAERWWSRHTSEGDVSMPSTHVLTTKVARHDIAPNRRRGGDIRVLLGPATVGATSGFLGVLTLAPGEFVAEHYHPYSEEFLYVVRGTALVRLDGEDVTLAEGEAVLVPIGVRHRLTNTGDVEALLTFQLCPLAPEPKLGHVDTELLPGDGPALHVGKAAR
jgi:putative monooxygenase